MRGLFLLIFILTSSTAQAQEPVNFLHQTDIITKMKENFAVIDTYSARFKLTMTEDKKTKVYRGSVYYQKGGKVHYDFKSPYPDKIISDGSTMWVYIHRLNAVGIQKLSKKNNSANLPPSRLEGLVRLFERYHYRFDSPEQPKKIKGKSFYVLELDEKVSSGGYQSMTVYVNPETYYIERIKGKRGNSKVVNLEFSSIVKNPKLKSGLFSFKVKDGVKVVEDPLTIN